MKVAERTTDVTLPTSIRQPPRRCSTELILSSKGHVWRHPPYYNHDVKPGARQPLCEVILRINSNLLRGMTQGLVFDILLRVFLTSRYCCYIINQLLGTSWDSISSAVWRRPECWCGSRSSKIKWFVAWPCRVAWPTTAVPIKRLHT